MAFKPKNSGGERTERDSDFESFNRPVPKSGSRKARVSLIVDLGIQNQEDYEDEKTGEKKPRKPAHQVAVFADLVNDVVDYGGEIGEQQYRLPLNKEFQRVLQGINFNTVAPKDADGNTIKGKPWGLHPRNALYLLAKACGKEEITYEGKHKESLDISLLLNQPFLAQVEVVSKPHKEGKKDKDGKVIVYTNVYYKGASPVPTIEDDDGNEVPMKVAELRQKPLCITFDDATAEDIQFIRPSLIKQIKLANNYVGSQMQKAIEEYEANNAGSSGDDGDDEPEEKPAKPAKAKEAAKPKAKPKAAPVEDEEEDVPF